MKIRQASVGDYCDIAQLVAKLNVDPASQCIHSGEGAEAIQKQMEIGHEAGEFAYVVAETENGRFDKLSGRLPAAIGGEFDEEAGRCWLWGPHSSLDDWEPITAELFATLQQVLPETITIYDCYLNEENERGLDFYRSVGFSFRGQAHVYVALRPEQILPGADEVARVTAVTAPGMITLHNAIFPETFIPGKSIYEKVDETHQVFVQVSDGQVVGYIYAVVDDADKSQGYIEFVGVAEQARGHGIGGKLLRAALAWLFAEEGVQEVGLNVDDTNTNARGLYEKVGFSLKYSGVNLRFERQSN